MEEKIKDFYILVIEENRDDILKLVEDEHLENKDNLNFMDFKNYYHFINLDVSNIYYIINETNRPKVLTIQDLKDYFYKTEQNLIYY